MKRYKIIIKGFLNSFIKKMKEKDGASTYITLMVSVLVMLMLSTVVFEYLRVKANLSDIERTLENSLVSYATDNWDEIYKSAREGYSGAYKLENESSLNWIENIDSDRVIEELKSELKLNNALEKEVGSDTAYKIKNINTYLQNVGFKNKSNNLYIVSEVEVEVPIIVGFKSSPSFSVKLRARSRYQNKF